MENPNNHMLAAGRLERPLELSHEVMNEPFFAFLIVFTITCINLMVGSNKNDGKE